MTSEELLFRRTVVSASGLVYWVGVLIHARNIRKRIGRSPNVRPRGRKEKALWAGWFLVILAWIGQPWLVGAAVTSPATSLLPGLLHPADFVAGLAMIAVGYAGTLWTYAVMGTNWRMGVDTNERTVLVCSGPFRWVRHPIYLLQIVMLTGAILLLPTPVSVGALAMHYLCVRLKARDEEQYLQKLHGLAYRDYFSRTGGLFPRMTRRGAAAKHGAPPKS